MVVWGLVIAMFLKGCATHGEEASGTGILTCLGFCELQVANRERSVTVEADGKATEVEEIHGIAHPPNVFD